MKAKDKEVYVMEDKIEKSPDLSTAFRIEALDNSTRVTKSSHLKIFEGY